MNDTCPLCPPGECRAYPKIWANLRRPDGHRWIGIHDDLNGITRTEPVTLPSVQHAYPPVTTQLANALGAAVKFIASGGAIVSDEEQARRHAICKAPCQHYDAAKDGCFLCGCTTSYKARIASQSCPIGLW